RVCGGDCNDSPPAGAAIHPGAAELCDSVDNDCDTYLDGADPQLVLTPCELTLGVCTSKLHRADQCGAGGVWAACNASNYGAAYGVESCDAGLDNDCDGLTNAGDPSLTLAPCENQAGVCNGTLHARAQCQLNGTWQACVNADYEAHDPRFGNEECDGADNNCNSLLDEADPALVIPPCENQTGLCAGALHRPLLCNGALGWRACEAADYEAHDAAYSATELCDGVDNDCSGTVPANEADADGDGYRVCGGDCNDSPPAGAAIHPGAVETCDGVDNDCDGFLDGNDPQLVLAPCELSQGVCASKFHRADQCGAGGVWAACDGSNYGASYGAEVCDAGLDNDCDGLTNAADASLVLAPCGNQAGVCSGALHARAQCQANGTWTACAAADYEAHDALYGVEECDGADNDCDGQVDGNDASLSLPLCEKQGGLCAGAAKRPGLCYQSAWHACTEADYQAHDARYDDVELCDGLDNDCSGTVPANEADADGDGHRVCGGDCNDSPPAGAAIHPGAAELCDSVDNDCDTYLDGADPQLVLTPCELTLGVCASTYHRADQCVSGGWAACNASNYGASYGVESCDAGLDNDCDGLTNAVDPSLTLAPCENQAGVCSGALHARAQCQLGGSWLSCGAAQYEAHDARYGDEVCDGVDNNCNAQLDQVDPLLIRPLCENQTGLCAGALHRASLCQAGAGWASCDATDYELNDPAYNAAELCDRVDNDCSGGLPAAEVDGDGDGYTPCEGDCLDGDIDVNPGELEVCNSKDDDCDGFTDALDGSLELAPCELQAGVCAGSEHALNQCVAGGWLPCTDSEYTAHSAYFGEEVCGDAGSRDEDCSGVTNDRDADEDGYLHIACGGNDCNDDSAAAHPGASEVQDLTDNDCDGLVDEGVIPVGSLIVTELLPNPGLPGDAYGEWFEVYNDSAISVNLHSWRIRDDGTNMFQVAAPAGLIIAPGQSMVFCRNGDPELNGGVVCDYVYGEGGNVFELANSGGDEIVLTLDGLIIDWMNYSTTTDGRSRSLDPSAYDDGANDTLANWCVTPANAAYQLPGGDYGTPGQMNVLCAGSIALASVSPGSGIEQGGETLTLQGTGFTGATAVSVCGAACASFSVVDDNAITCVTAAHAPADCDVTVTKGPASSTLTAAYRFTGVDGSPGIGWCDLQWPLTATARVGSDSALVFGRVWKSGVTEPAGAPAGITGQLGYGPLGSDPRSSVGWRWLTANWNPSCVGCGNNDEFMRQFNLPVTGTWSYVYRFSDDGGYTYVFCDFNPGAPPFSTGEMGTLTVTP
ncbi:MAG TPA: MopE-related protein, partial [Myxococcota bacterium]|nr:MopE-related protein [Myxococcota bacterium]